jgi:hypothetical protein
VYPLSKKKKKKERQNRCEGQGVLRTIRELDRIKVGESRK